MQLTKPTLSLFAEDFELMKAKLSSDEIVNILSGISDLCIFGETEYKPETKQQIYFWDKVKSKFDHDLSAYNASVNNGRMGGRPKKQNPDNNPEKTQDITQRKPSSHFTLDTCQVNTCLKKTQSSDKSSDCVARKKLVPVDWWPKNETIDKLKAKGLDAEKTVEKFINSCRAKNLKYIDFDRAILAWDWSKDESVKQDECWF